MAEVFNVEAVLELRSNAGTVLRELATQFREFDRIVKSSQEALSGFERVLRDFSGSARSIRSVTQALEQVGRVNFAGLKESESALAAVAGNMEKIAQLDTAAVQRFSGAIGKLATADMAPAVRQVGQVADAIEKAAGAERNLATAAEQAGRAIAEQVRAAQAPRTLQAAQAAGGAAPAEKQATALEASAKAAADAAAAMRRMSRVDFSQSIAGADKLAKALDATAQAATAVSDNAAKVASSWNQAAKSAKDAADSMKTALPAGAGAGGAGSGRTHGGGDHLMIAGMAAQMVGGALTEGVRKAYEPAASVASMTQLLQTDTRVTRAQALEAQQKAIDLAIRPRDQGGVPGSTALENIGALRDLKLITGDLGEAEAILPQFAQLSQVLNILQERKTGHSDPAFAAAKSIELLGKMFEETRNPITGAEERKLSMPEFIHTMNQLTQMMINTQGRVDPNMFLAFAKQGNIAGMQMSDKFLFQDLPMFLMTQGGQRTGTAFTSMMQVFEGNRMTAKSLQAMIDVGLAAPDAIKRQKQIDPKTGRLRTRELVSTDAIYDLPMMFQNLPEYLAKAQDRMEKAGIHGIDAQIKALMAISQRSTIARFLAEALKDLPVFQREEASFKAVRPDTLKFLQDTSPAANMQILLAAMTNFATVIGLPAMKDAVATMQFLTSVLRDATKYFSEHKTAARVITDAVAAFGGVVTVLGSISLTLAVTTPALRLFATTIKRVGEAAGIATAEAGGGKVPGVGSKVLPLVTPLTLPLMLGGDAGPNSGALSPQDAAKVRADAIAKGYKTPGEAFSDWLHNTFGFGGGAGAAPPTPSAGTKRGQTSGDALHVIVDNQVSGKDIRDGVTRHQADQLALPPSQPSWFDQSMTPGISPNPIGP